MRIGAWVLVVSVVGAVAGCAPRPPRTYKLDAKAVPYQGYAATYPSGLRLIAYQMPQADRFMVATSIAAGAARDPAGQEGLAHVVEHLAYRARPSGVDQPHVDEWLAASGWRWNASTSHDATTFWEVGKPADLAAAIALEAVRLRDPLAGVTEAEFAREREVVLSEYRERTRDDVWGTAVDELLAAAFSGSGYGHGPGGRPESLAATTLSSARAWTKEHYVAARALVVVVSPLPPQQVSELVLERFGDLALGQPGAARVAPASDPPFALAPRRAPAESRVVHAAIERPRVWMAWPVPGRFAPGTPHANVVANALASRVLYQVSRLWLRDDVADVDAGILDLGGAGLAWASAEVRDESVAPKMIEAMREAMREHLDDFAMMGADSHQVLLDRILMNEYVDLEELDAARVASFARATGSDDYVAEWPRRAFTQLHTSAGAYANRWLLPEQGVAVVALPNRSVSAAARAVRAAPDRIDPLEDEASGVRVPGADAILKVAPPPGLHAAERRELANGLHVVVARRGRHGVAEVRLVVRTDVEGGPRVPRFAPALAISHSAGDHAASRASRLGATTRVSFTPEHVTCSVVGSSTTLPSLLASAAGWASRLSFDEPAVERTRIALRRRLEWYRETPTSQAFSLLRSGLFGDHPYGSAETIDTLLAVKPDAAGRWLSDQVRPQRATLIVVSDEPATPGLWRAIEDEFGGWKRGGSTPEVAPVPPVPERRRILLVDRPGAAQAMLLVGVRAPATAERDEVATDAARWLLESRINRRLRVEEGVAYGAHVTSVEHDRAAAFVARADVDARSAAHGIRTIVEAAGALATEPVEPGAAARARWRVARDFAFRFDRVSGAADALEDSAVHGRDDDAWEVRPASIAALTPARIRAAASALATGREVIVVVGDRSVLEPQLEAAGLTLEKGRAGAAP